jgi:TPP-dependent indolepyruvate ferredoxin oxidoreductase alpha subunit
LGVDRVAVLDPVAERKEFERTLLDMLDRRQLAVLIARRACLLLARKLRPARELGAGGQLPEAPPVRGHTGPGESE